MSYHALYRKYRPSTLEDVVGQEYIIKIIKNSLKNNKVSHAYMFSGPRGTGKTTLAKILAKNVNCLDLKDGQACGKCKNCKSIEENSTSDIIEIDAASNNGVDEIREIRNKINLVPSELKYKVYIIDEVHMLSIGAFNALLKTLEEPPEHIVFVLATTDVHKVPITIISRCQCFDFHRLTEQEIKNRLSFIVKEENIDVEEAVLDSIANLCDGGLRDAIGMLDKIYSYSDSKITMTEFEELNGIVSLKSKLDFLKLVESKDVASVIKFIDKIYNSGKDFSIFCQDLLILCRNMIVNYYTDGKCDFDVNFLLKFVEFFSQLSSEIKMANNIRIVFEIKILSFMNLVKETNSKSTDIIDNDSQLEKNIEKKVDVEVPLVKEEAVKIEKSAVEEEISEDNTEINYQIINNCFARADKAILTQLKNDWELFNDYALDSEFGSVACYIVDGTVRAASKNEIIITFDYESMVNRGYKIIKKIEYLFEKIFNHKYFIAIITTDDWNKKKQEYIDNKNKGIIYEYKELNFSSEKNQEEKKVIKNSGSDSIMDEAIELFGENIVTNI